MTEVDPGKVRLSFLLKKAVKVKPEKMAVYTAIFDALAAPPPATYDPSRLLEFFIGMDYAAKFQSCAEKFVMAGGSSPTDLADGIRNLVAEYDTELAFLGTGKDSTLEVTDDITAIIDKVYRGKGGLEWRLEELNLAVGPVGNGDLIVVGARPNVGKTRFMVSELTHWMTQLPRDETALIFNNEEDGIGIKGAVLCAGLNRDIVTISKDTPKAREDFDKKIGWGRIKIIDRAYMTTGFCEKLIRSYKPRIVVFNQLYKVSGVSRRDATDTENMRRTYQWAREIAKDLNCLVVSAHQADVRGEGQKVLTQDMLYGTKTGVQGEVDLCLMIGKTHDPAEADKRTINIARNKLPGGPRTKPEMRETSFECAFDGARSRYNSLLLGGTTPS
jgi:replicative DNA helicase